MLGEPEAAGASRLAVRGVCGPATRQGVPATIPVASTGGSVGDDLAGTSSAAESGVGLDLDVATFSETFVKEK